MDAQLIKPKIRGKADFFSWQLYRWMKKFPGRHYINEIDGELFIGDMPDNGWLHAARLRQLCLSGAQLQAWAFGPAHGVSRAKDVTDKFWLEYMNIGVCAIHGDYAHNWETDGGERVCAYCKKVERKTIEMLPHEVWA